MSKRFLWGVALLLLTSATAYADPPSVVGQWIAVAPTESLYVSRVGQSHGSPVLVLTSLVGSASAFSEFSTRIVATGRSVVTIDPLGMGASSRPTHADYSLDAQARRIEAAARRLGVLRAVVVAHGVGASIAWRLADRAPDMVNGIVSIEGGIVESQATPGLSRVRWLAPLAGTSIGRRVARQRFRDMLRSGSATDTWVTDSVVTTYLQPVVRDVRATLRAWGRMAESRDQDSTAHVVQRLRQPITLLLGAAPSARARAGGVSAEEVVLMRRLAPHIDVRAVSASGWFVHEEQPDAVVRAVLAMAGELTARSRHSPD
jgi:pimeloyl-ACP methyl ester carboxylesterase